MTNDRKMTALVTGANSGIGFETAARLAEEGFSNVILACRTTEKADTARAKLIERTDKQVFDVLAVDVAEPESVQAACDALMQRQTVIDLLILNAGMSTGENRAWNSDGVELTFASSLIGHHVMAMRLLGDQLLSPDAHIVIAGSEGSRGDFPGMTVADFGTFADEHFGGDLEAALETIARYKEPYDANPMSFYVTSKVYANWWAAVLARKLSNGTVVNAISPGSVPNTSFARHQNFFMRRIMLPMMVLVGPFTGMAWTAEDAANRYLEAGRFDANTTGNFFASPPGKFTGQLEIQKDAQFLNKAYQDAGWNVIVKLAGGVDYPSTL